MLSQGERKVGMFVVRGFLYICVYLYKTHSNSSLHHCRMSSFFVHLNRSSHGWKGPAGGICGGVAWP